MQVRQLVDEPSDLDRLKALDATMTIAVVPGRVRVTTEELNVFPVQKIGLRARSGKSPKQSSEDGRGTDIDSSKLQSIVRPFEPEIVGPGGPETGQVQDLGVQDVALQPGTAVKLVGLHHLTAPEVIDGEPFAGMTIVANVCPRDGAQIPFSGKADDNECDRGIVARSKIDNQIIDPRLAIRPVDDRELEQLREHLHYVRLPRMAV
jgi:hypothetical protein